MFFRQAADREVYSGEKDIFYDENCIAKAKHT
jgi:hypothetical protein